MKEQKVIGTTEHGEVIAAQTYEGYRAWLSPSRIPCDKAAAAIKFVEEWGMVAAKESGEDSAGRQKLAILSEVECVQRACNMAEILFDEFEIRGWHVPTPKLEDVKKAFEGER